MMITSANNAKLKQIIQLQKKVKVRRETELFIEEGIRMFREIPKSRLKQVYFSESFSQKKENREEISHFHPQIEPVIVSDEIFKTLTDTINPQGILAVVHQENYTLEEILNKKENPLLLVLENIQDPGNLGTMMRTAEAAGVTGVILSKGSVDMYNPKVVRATMGAIFRLPFVYVNQMEELISSFRERKITSCAACLAGAVEYDTLSYQQASALFIGNEGNGLSDEVIEACDYKIKIPMEGKAESLNAAVCAAVYMYEAYRQRRMK